VADEEFWRRYNGRDPAEKADGGGYVGEQYRGGARRLFSLITDTYNTAVGLFSTVILRRRGGSG
jgi:hypothetical protein